MIFVSVSTPLKDSGVGAGFAPDLQHWERIARLIARLSSSSKVIVERSTVPVKTASAMTKVLTAVNRMSSPWVVLSNPEFATEGNAVMDQASPERIMIGGGESDEEMAAVDKLAAVYAR
jgi:UDPglucose 6-dehydrogenase